MEDWSAVAEAISDRVNELGWRQGELAERSHVSRATVREIQHHIVQRRRSARTLEALSTTLGWHPRHIEAVLHGRRPPELPEPTVRNGESLWSRMDALEQHLSEITERLDAIQADLITVIDHVRKDS
ncbi:MAG: helix-turn-helix transcriptional regulator [Actinomycetota bacterium]|nr:helix-turn-helix transcriptional regulator [Actinomycetota bacterium]